jgi:hypothetical protein
VRYWWREVLGFALVALGLFIFYDIYVSFTGARYVETITWLIVGIFIFRGGLQLMKVALAARICSDVPSQGTATTRSRGDRHSVVPGRTAPMGQT